jgi:hypothetical protein
VDSLLQLNAYSNQLLSYEDDRAYVITFSDDTPDTQAIAVTEGNTHVTQSGTNITSVISTPSDITFTIDLTGLTGATVTWANLPSGVTASTPSTDVYRLTGVNSPSIWTTIKTATITMPRDTGNNFSYTSTIGYPTYSGSSMKQWTTNVTVTNLAELSAANNISYYGGFAQSIDGNPVILDIENTTGTYSMVITPNNTAGVSTISSLGTGGSTSFNGTTRALTITGTRTEVNSHLDFLVMDPEDGYTGNLTLNYSLTNPVSNLNTQVTQTLTYSGVGIPIINSELPRTYTENQQNLLFPTAVPQILENLGYTYDISLQLNSNIGFISTSSTASGWTTGNLTYNFSGTNSQCNTVFSTLRFYPNQDIFTAANVNYIQKVGVTTQANVNFTLTGIEETNTTVAGGTTTKTYDSDLGTVTFADPVRVYPYWNSNVEVKISAVISGNTVNVGTFAGTGWTLSGNVLSASFVKPVSTTSINSNIAAVTFTAGSNTTTSFTMKQEVLINGSTVDTKNRTVNIQRDTVGTLALRSDYATASTIAETNAVYGQLISPYSDYSKTYNLAGNTSIIAVNSRSGSGAPGANVYTTTDNVTFTKRLTIPATVQNPYPELFERTMIYAAGFGWAAHGFFGSSANPSRIDYIRSTNGTSWTTNTVLGVRAAGTTYHQSMMSDGTSLFVRPDSSTVDLITLSGSTYTATSISNNFRANDDFYSRAFNGAGVLNSRPVMFGYSQTRVGETITTYPTVLIKNPGVDWNDLTDTASQPGVSGDQVRSMAWDGTYYYALCFAAGSYRWYRSSNFSTWTLIHTTTSGTQTNAVGILSHDGDCFVSRLGAISTNLKHFIEPVVTCETLNLINGNFYRTENSFSTLDTPSRQYAVGKRFSIYTVSDGTTSFRVAVAEGSNRQKAANDIMNQINTNATALSLGWVATLGASDQVIIDTNDNSSGSGTVTFTLYAANGAPGVSIDGVNNTFTVTII